MEKVGIFGYGEVGKAIAKFYQKPKIKDKKRDDGLKDLDILHICIPYSKDFVKIVKKQIRESNPELTIIHSTVPVGTTAKIGGVIVHSPVRGKHPDLYQGIKTFVKFVGYENNVAGSLAKKHFEKLGLKVKLIFDARNTEALKLWDTTQYGLMIILNKEIKKFCDKNKLDFDFIYTLGNRTYNEGYLKLKLPEVVRPWLKYMPGKIGGHCVIPNCRLLKSYIAKLVLKKNRTLKNTTT